MVDEFRLEHRNLADDELDKLVKQTFKIDRATLRVTIENWALIL